MARSLLVTVLLLIAGPVSAHEWVGWFEYGRAELSPRGYKVAREVVAFSKQHDLRKIVVTGHLDTAEIEEFSDKLSRRRAQSMATELVQLGIQPAIIEIHGRGARQLARATPTNISEPINRRVVVDVR